MTYLKYFDTDNSAIGNIGMTPSVIIINHKVNYLLTDIIDSFTLESDLNGVAKPSYLKAFITCSEDTTLPVWFTQDEYIANTPSEIIELKAGDNTIIYNHGIFRIGFVTYDVNTKKVNGGNNKVTAVKLVGTCKDGYRMFDNYTKYVSNITSIDVKDLDVSRCNTLYCAFQEPNTLDTTACRIDNLDLSNWDTSNITDFTGFCNLCSKLTSIGDLSNWDVSNVTNMMNMFNNCESLEYIGDLSNWDVSNVSNMRSMFSNCKSLEFIGDLSNWDVSNVTNMYWLFNESNSLKYLGDLSNWNISKVTNLDSIFYGCKNIDFIGNLSNWDVSNVTNMRNMFSNCKSLKFIGDLSNWDVSNVTNMRSMFWDNESLEYIGDISNWNTSKVTTMSGLFGVCYGITSLDLSKWDVSSVTNMSAMFHGMHYITDLGDISNWDVSNVVNMAYMFNNCNKLTGTLDLSKWDMSNVTSTLTMFQYCYGLDNLILPDTISNMGSFFVNHCTGYNQETFEIPSSVTSIGTSHALYDFGKDNVLKRFVVRKGNTSFVTDSYGVLYSSDYTRLVSIPRAVEVGNNGTYSIEEGVTFLGELSFSRVHTINTLILPNSYVITRSVPYRIVPDGSLDTPFTAEMDNPSNPVYINYGNSLALAIYCYTTISKYEVKDNNPNYSSYNGCIYSKDGTELIAVPTRFNGALDIKEGCTTIGQEAFWEGSDHTCDGVEMLNTSDTAHHLNITSISIPKTVTYITSEQLMVLNALLAGGVNITIDSNNTKYQVSNGIIIEK